MTRVFLRLAYRGTGYRGWQTQAPGLPTVQSAVEGALARMLGYRGHVHGCGRTDAGVHAADYYAHLTLRAGDPLGYDPVFRLNRLLPPDISVRGWHPVLAEAHAQRDATWRAYRYRVATRKSPFDEGLAGRYDDVPLDVPAMRAVAAAYAKTDPDGTLDFRAFCRRPDRYPHTRCRIDACALAEAAGGVLDFDIRADRFLHRQVRLLVARMLDVGAGRLPLAAVERALRSGESLPRKRPAAAAGLYLVGVGYPPGIWRGAAPTD